MKVKSTMVSWAAGGVAGLVVVVGLAVAGDAVVALLGGVVDAAVDLDVELVGPCAVTPVVDGAAAVGLPYEGRTADVSTLIALFTGGGDVDVEPSAILGAGSPGPRHAVPEIERTSAAHAAAQRGDVPTSTIVQPPRPG